MLQLLGIEAIQVYNYQILNSVGTTNITRSKFHLANKKREEKNKVGVWPLRIFLFIFYIFSSWTRRNKERFAPTDRQGAQRVLRAETLAFVTTQSTI